MWAGAGTDHIPNRSEGDHSVNTSTIRPGLLVSLHTYVRGGVSYSRRDLERGRTEDGAEFQRWETDRLVPDPVEYQRASDVRAEARKLIARECLATAFGLLCPVDREPRLRAAIGDARALVDDFNRTARRCRIEIPILLGRIAQDDEAAIRAVSAEARALLDEMAAGVASLNVDRIRENATKARALAGMLSPDAERTVSLAIDEARRVARRIVDAGERAAVVVGEVRTARLDAARFAFLDVDGEIGAVVADALPLPARSVDFEDAAPDPVEPPSYAYAPPAPLALDFGG